MGPRPVIFVSAVSQELRTAREFVARELLKLGYEPVSQEILGTEAGDIRQMLREKIAPCAGLIQLLGHRYGLEPPAPDAHFGRVSYTQFEPLYARQQGRKVWYLLLDGPFPFDPAAEEPAELRALQAAYRQRVEAGTHVYHHIHSLDALRAAVRDMRDDLAPLRRQWKQLVALVLVLLVLCAGLGVWMVQKQSNLEHVVADPAVLRVKLEEKIEETFERKKGELLAAKAPPAEIDALYRWRDRAKGQVAEGVAFITARAADPKSPIIARAAAILEERGVDATLEFLDTTLKAERQHLKEKGRQLAEASMMKAGLHESRFETAEQERAIRDALADAPDWWLPHNALGLILKRRAHWQPAEQEYELARKSMGADGEATVLSNLATLYQATNRLAEAEPLMERALKIDEKRYGPEHPEVATDLNNLAQLYQATNRLAEAEPLMERVLKIDEKRYGPEHPKVAIRLNNLASLYQATNRLAEAEPLLERALKIDEKSYGPEQPEVATDLNNLAQLYQATNRLAEAEPLMKRVASIFEKSYGPEHPNVATSLNNLAQLYQATNRLAEAEPLMERALKIAEKSYGPEHPEVATDLSNLAALYYSTNREAKAEPLMGRALKIDDKSYGPEHPKVATDLNNLAQLYQATNRLAEAEPLMERALKIDEQSYGPEHPNVATRLSNLAALYYSTNRLAEAEPLLERALKIDEKSFGPEHPNVAIKLNNLAQLYQATNRLAEAEPLMRRNLLIKLKSSRAAGHAVSNLKLGVTNYRLLLSKMPIPEAEVPQRLATVGREAGFTPEEFTELLIPMFGPFDVTVTEIVPDGQGPALGIRVGDVVRRYHGEEITKAADLVKLTGETKDDAIPLEVQRGDETLRLTAKPGRLGLQLDDRPKAIGK